MNKYSVKIIKFINENLNNVINISNISANKFFDNITKLITETYNQNYNYQPIILSIPKIHESNQYPLIYVLLCKLYSKGILNEFHNLCDFNKFINWYRENQSYIENKLHENIKLLDEESNKDIYQLYHFIYENNGNRSNLHNLIYNNSFVSLDIQQHAESTVMTNYIFNTSEFNLSIYLPIANKYIDINKIIHIIKFMNQIGKRNDSICIPNVYIFAGLQRKQFPENSYILCHDNVNSGSSVRCEYVKIWRSEEVYKVLIHELIHFHKLDFNYFSKNYDKLSNYIINTYNIKGTDSPNESYTETLALIIHSLFISYYYKYKIKDILKYEIIFTLFQISKILKFFNITNTKEISHKPIYQSTSVFSYFIVKGSLIISLESFLNYINYDINNLSINDKVESFSNLIKDCMNENYFQQIDKMIDATNKIKLADNSFMMRTLRMTCFQL